MKSGVEYNIPLLAIDSPPCTCSTSSSLTRKLMVLEFSHITADGYIQSIESHFKQSKTESSLRSPVNPFGRDH
jgi:hypothetical protein